MSFTFAEICTWCGGRSINPADVSLTGVSTDTRTIAPGQLFVALEGEAFDGHDYVEQAVARGAAAVMISRNGSDALSVPAVRVDDTVRALGALAEGQRARFQGPVVAITGSNGKTTTKELCADILTVGGIRVRRTPGNLNNHIGMPLSILRLEPEDEALVIELGMSHSGEIATLARIARPHVGAITQVAAAHIGLLGSLEAIARAKGELLDELPEDGVAVLNADDPQVMAQRARFGGRLIRFGFSEEAEFRAEGDPEGGAFTLHTPLGTTRVQMQLPGRHLVLDALCAAACAYASGLLGTGALETMRSALEGFRGVPGRLTRIETPGGLTILDDSYNSNPDSVRAALGTLGAVRGDQRTVVVLADMLEQGEQAAAIHAGVGRAVAECAIDVLVAVGPLSLNTAEAARDAGVPAVVHCDDVDAATRELATRVRAGDLILVKGSRGMTMERAVRALETEI